MKNIKIFLASSIEDLKDDRLQIGSFINQINNIYVEKDIFFSLVMCEEYDNSITLKGKQAEFDREIRESELVFFLFFHKVGEYTKHEFDVALEAFKNNGKPKIVTYFKNGTNGTAESVKEFMRILDEAPNLCYNVYEHIDVLKLGILMQIKQLSLDTFELSIRDGEVCLDGKRLIKTKNVPILNSNNTLMEFTQSKRELKEKLSLCRSTYLAEPSEENEKRLFDVSAELNNVSKQLSEVEKRTIDFLSIIAKMTSDGTILSYRQNEALKYYNQGLFDEAQAILSDEDSKGELKRTLHIG